MTIVGVVAIVDLVEDHELQRGHKLKLDHFGWVRPAVRGVAPTGQIIWQLEIDRDPPS